MNIIVNAEMLNQVKEAVKQLPVQGGFEVADQWVGIVLLLDNMIQTAEIAEPKEEPKEESAQEVEE